MRLMPLVAGALAVAVYLGSVGNGFTFDDPYIVVENPFARGERALSDAFTSHYWAGQEPSGSLYRPLTIATYRLNHDLAVHHDGHRVLGQPGSDRADHLVETDPLREGELLPVRECQDDGIA